MSPSQQTLAESIVFGESNLDTTVKQEFLAAGLTHVLAASGSNIVFLEVALEALIYPFWRRLRLPHLLWAFVMIAVAWLFAVVCGGQPSIERAALMSTYRWSGHAFGRRASMPMGVAVAATLLAVVAPLSMTSPSAWLSFVATAAMAAGLHRNRGRVSTVLHRWAQRFSGGWLMRLVLRVVYRGFAIVRTTLYIELWVAPIVLWLFAQITPYGVVSNVLCEPLLALLLPVTVLWIALAVVSHTIGFVAPLAVFSGQIVRLLVSLMQMLVHRVSTLPGALWQVSVVPGSVIVGYYTVLCCSIYLHRYWRNRSRF